MDPISISLGITGTIPLIASVTRLVRKYYDDVKDAQESIKLLLTELGLLEVALLRLDAFLASDKWRRAIQDLQVDQTSILHTCSLACSAKLKALTAKLEAGESGFSVAPRRFSTRLTAFVARFGNPRVERNVRYLLWPLNETEHKKAVQDLRNLTLWIQFSLSIDSIEILCDSADNMAQVMRRQLEQLEMLADAEETTAKLQLAVQDQTQRLEGQRNDRTKQRILEWIYSGKQHQRHHAIQTLRVKDTGGWLLQRPEFLRWKDGVDSSPGRLSNVLWCYGCPGTGKTMLA